MSRYTRSTNHAESHLEILLPLYHTSVEGQHPENYNIQLGQNPFNKGTILAILSERSQTMHVIHLQDMQPDLLTKCWRVPQSYSLKIMIDFNVFKDLIRKTSVGPVEQTIE